MINPSLPQVRWQEHSTKLNANPEMMTRKDALKTGLYEKTKRGQHDVSAASEGCFSKQIFDEAALKMGTMYSTPVPHCFKQKFFGGSPVTPKARNEFQKPRFTSSPWRRAMRESMRPNMYTVDNSERDSSEDKQLAQPKTFEVVRQSTILWQDIHPNADCPGLLEKRREALKAALKSRKDRRHRREKEFSAQIRRAPTSPNRLENVDDITKQSVKFPSRAHSDDLNYWIRPNKDVRLASISTEALAPKTPEAKASLNASPRAKTVFVSLTIPGASYGNKTVLPSLHKLV